MWFDKDRIYIETATGEVLSQPLAHYIALDRATDRQRSKWSESPFGLHWDDIDEDISFESFTWGDDDPKALICQRP